MQLKDIRKTLDRYEEAPDEMTRLYHMSNAKSLTESMRVYYLAKLGLMNDSKEEQGKC